MPKIHDINPLPFGDIHGTDLGIPFLYGQETHFLFGDTFRTPLARSEGPPKGGLSNWRSPVLTRQAEYAPGRPLSMNAAEMGGAQLRPYPHDGSLGGVKTFLPTDGVTIGDTRYVWVMGADVETKETIWCEIWTSKAQGPWEYDGIKRDAKAFGGLRQMVTWDRGRDGYVYILSTGGLKRNKNAIMHRVKEGQLLNEDAWEHWFWDGSKWRWDDNEASEILQRGYHLGEIQLRWIQGHWVFAGFDHGAYNAFVKTGYGKIEGINWYTTQDQRPIHGYAGLKASDEQPRLYGCYVHPRCKFTDPSWTMIVSDWSESGDSYKAAAWSIPTPTAMGELVMDSVAPPAAELPPLVQPDPIVRQVKIAPGEIIEVSL